MKRTGWREVSAIYGEINGGEFWNVNNDREIWRGNRVKRPGHRGSQARRGVAEEGGNVTGLAAHRVMRGCFHAWHPRTNIATPRSDARSPVFFPWSSDLVI